MMENVREGDIPRRVFFIPPALFLYETAVEDQSPCASPKFMSLFKAKEN